MKFVFNNIDKEYVKNRAEYMGDIQPKFWFSSKNASILVKRQHSQKVIGQAKKSKMYNHFGEYFGYLLAKKAKIKSCPVDLISVHDKKNKYSKSVLLYPACGIEKLLTREQNMILGEFIVSGFAERFPEKYKALLEEKNCSPAAEKIISLEPENNIDVIIAAIIAQTVHHEKSMGVRTESQIKEDVEENLVDAFNMFAYDCILGNNDRHSQNWAMFTDISTGRLQMYPLYDNERVLGLSKPEADVRRTLLHGDLENATCVENFSRMGTAPIHSGASYKQILEHLVKRYPDYAVPAIKQIISNISIEDIEELYSASEGIIERSEFADELSEEAALPREYRTYGVALYNERSSFARGLLQRNKAKNEKEELILT